MVNEGIHLLFMVGEAANKAPQFENTDKDSLNENSKVLNSLLRHEVKNKMHLIKGYLDLTESEIQAETSNLEKMDGLVQQALDIIEKVHNFEQLKRKDVKEINVIPLVKQAVKKSRGEEDDIDVEYVIDCDPCEVRGSSLLEEVFSNIIGNAVDHSGCSRIFISVKRKEDEILVRIEDDGCGIPDDLQKKLFQRGTKEEESGGSGLGLYIVQKITEHYGGNIKVHDSSLGGARFDIHLEKAK